MSVNSEKGSSKADTLIKVVLVFFISLLSFSVGTFVGHQFSKSEQRRMALEGEFKTGRDVASADAHDEEKISEKEVESLTEEFVNKEKAGVGEPVDTSENEVNDHAEHKAEEHGAPAAGYKTYPRGKTADVKPEAAKPAAHDDHAEHADHKQEAAADAHGKPAAKAPAAPSKHGASEAAEKVSKGEAPSDGKKETRKPSSALPAVANSAAGKYTVQVAAYADEAEAKTHAATLKSKGWTAFYVPANVQGKTWYRVSIGIYDSNQSANEARAQYMKDSNSKTALVQKIVQ